MLAHERVLEAIMQRGPVLPMRFGTRLAGEEDLATVLRERHDELERSLQRVRGRVELGLRVLPCDGARPARPRDGVSGRDYLLARVAEQRHADRIAHELHEPLAELAHEARLEERAAPPALLVGSYLVDRQRVEAFRARARELATDRRDTKVVVTGPWPAYSFTSEHSS